MNNQQKFRVFVFSKTAGFRHDSIPAGIEGLKRLGASTNRFTVDASEDSSLINAAFLSQFKVVVFLSTSGEFLSKDETAGLRTYINRGGGFVGIHCASAGMHSEPWYGELVGAYFTGHPEPQHSVVRVENNRHVIVSGYPHEFKWFDEWYNFSRNPREKVTVLLSTDESLYNGGTMGRDHPLAWCREFDGGRSFYTSLGHFDEAYQDEGFMKHVLNGILWAARLA
ncbi:Crp/FNR family transcriptional regulator [Xylaria intraflava]|nr:Crp/FNR family transcriptional regulator [Xylaria intraflava]